MHVASWRTKTKTRIIFPHTSLHLMTVSCLSFALKYIYVCPSFIYIHKRVHLIIAASSHRLSWVEHTIWYLWDTDIIIFIILPVMKYFRVTFISQHPFENKIQMDMPRKTRMNFFLWNHLNYKLFSLIIWSVINMQSEISRISFSYPHPSLR